ncbi:EAL domain-containing protein [Shimwellia pseudoproteus]|uniref:EAL domain-containing protein n=1 Tax=Shimwellia pseudoproteus TaxID=570012 RepID=UPI0018ECB401|nr:EAL domain-containing protein [Shimwellia pseudoproteus]MBJ3813923.1 EAL domain-containing protein [Shimwellia pseudoproteus]
MRERVIQDYVLSPCHWAANGLRLLMASDQQPVSLLPAEGQGNGPRFMTADVKRLVVFLPGEPYWGLATLHQVAVLIALAEKPLPVLILSRSPAAWLWKTLLNWVGNPRQLSAVHAAPSDLPYPRLAGLMQQRFRYCPLLKQLFLEDAERRRIPSEGLTRAELQTALDMLRGKNIHEQVKRRGISLKTLYRQKTSGLKKMVEYHPELAARFPKSLPRHRSLVTLSAFERAFMRAISEQQIIPVFQPIVDNNRRLKGVEILARWRCNDNSLLLPGEFLPHLQADIVWQQLTAWVLQEAVCGINQYAGAFYFTANIPASVARERHLLAMVKAATAQLHQPQWAARLVLEFTETLDLNRFPRAAANLEQLQQAGVRVMLDDCFSRNSVFFPVRTAHFNAYKLDMSIVSDAQHDDHARNLIKTLVYYCRLTGSGCIAEGVDSQEKRRLLEVLGITHFQGYLFSPPVTREYLPALIDHFLSDDTVK